MNICALRIENTDARMIRRIILQFGCILQTIFVMTFILPQYIIIK
jgi:hypothetical protein